MAGRRKSGEPPGVTGGGWSYALQRIQGERDQAWTRANSAEATIDFAGRRADTAKKEAEKKRDEAQAEVTKLRAELAVARADNT